MRNQSTILIIALLSISFFNCSDNKEHKTSNSNLKTDTISTANNAICSICGKAFHYEGLGEFEDIFDDLDTDAKEDTLCSICYKKSLIPTKIEIDIYNDYSKENEKRLRSISFNKSTASEYDDSTVNILDKKIMLRWKIDNRTLDETIIKVINWASSNGYLNESIVTEEGIKSAILQRKELGQ